MPEILTESFCERCGTRYTFESARPRVRLKGVKVLSRGLKNFVLSDGTTMDEAMASARSETDREVTAHQLDAFHKTFNFCMSCRQYTCPNCWNEAEARCLTCAPHLGHEILPAPFPDLASNNGTHGTNGAGAATTAQPDVWVVPEATADPATTYDDIDAVARLAMLTGTQAPIDAEPVLDSEPMVQVAPTVAAEPPVEGDPEVPGDAETDPESVARLAAFAAAEPIDAPATAESNLRMTIGEKTAAQTGGLLRRFRPGQDLDAELAAYERQQAAPSPADVAVEAPAVEPQVVEPEVFAESLVEAPAIAEPLPEVVAAPEPALETVVEALPEPEPVAAAAAEPEPIVNDVIAQPTWRMIAPDPTPAEPTTAIPAAATRADPTSEPQWPTRPAWLGGAPTNGLPFLNRPVAPQGGIEALWAESSREVVTAPLDAGKPVVGGIQPCISCGLSLSANARFCRRCGTLQGS